MDENATNEDNAIFRCQSPGLQRAQRRAGIFLPRLYQEAEQGAAGFGPTSSPLGPWQGAALDIRGSNSGLRGRICKEKQGATRSRRRSLAPCHRGGDGAGCSAPRGKGRRAYSRPRPCLPAGPREQQRPFAAPAPVPPPRRLLGDSGASASGVNAKPGGGASHECGPAPPPSLCGTTPSPAHAKPRGKLPAAAILDSVKPWTSLPARLPCAPASTVAGLLKRSDFSSVDYWEPWRFVASARNWVASSCLPWQKVANSLPKREFRRSGYDGRTVQRWRKDKICGTRSLILPVLESCRSWGPTAFKMSALSSDCPHLESVGEITKEELIQKSHGTCQDCKVRGPNLWACLENRCSYVGCGESHVDHSTIHSQDTQHCLTVNLTTLRVWCYACSKEVFLDRKLRTRSPLPNARLSHQAQENSVQDFKIPGNPTLKIPLVAVFDDLDIEVEEDELRTRGLTGLKNIGNTCYMNAALQALSNCPPLTQFFLDCGALARTDKKPAICKSYLKLMTELWHKSRPGSIVPTNLFQGIKTVNPTFRGYSQQDAQEFLRCLMDLLHEELKEPVMEIEDVHPTSVEENMEEDKSQSDLDFQSCESCNSSDKAENEASYKPLMEDPAESAMLIQDDENHSLVCKDWQKEKILCNKLNRTNSMEVLEKDMHSTSETAEFLNNQGTVKVQIHSRLSDYASGDVHTNDLSAAQSPPKSVSSWSPLAPSHKVPGMSSPKKKKQKRYRSIISDIFDGTIISSVQCLTCDRVSVTLETFQDLSLPIPGKEDLAKLHSASHQTSLVKAGSCGEAYAPQGWIAFFMEYIKSWFWGPVVTLQDCLAAFFARDELKGDNMYSCEKCKKLRNGVKFCKVQTFPEILCIHLKRFRHELMFSTKIGTHVSFPLEGLDLQPFLAKDSPTQVVTYDLLSVICHHGTASSGHYIAYCRNNLNNLWYEFDDQSVTEVTESTVQNAEAYVLFYRKSSEEAQRERRRISSLLNMMEPSLLQFYISRQWLNKFKTFAEPGPISNHDFLCVHGGVPPRKATFIENLVLMLPQNIWDNLYSRYGGGPAVNHLYICHTCQIEAEKIEKRRKTELEMFVRLYRAFQEEESPSTFYCISMQWFREWEGFVKGKDSDPPGPVDNTKIAVTKCGNVTLKQGADSGQISEETWNFLQTIYGGGPEVILRPPVAPVEPDILQTEEKIELETRGL